MLSFMNSKLTKMTGKDKQNHIFQKSQSYETSRTEVGINKSYIFHNFKFHVCLRSSGSSGESIYI